VLADISTKCVSAGAGFGGGGNLRVDIIANLEAHWCGVGQVIVIAADVKRDSEVEERLAGF